MAVYQGVVKGNVVVLPQDVELPEGTAVEVRVAGLQQAEPLPEEQPDPSAASTALPMAGQQEELTPEEQQEMLFQQHLVEMGLMTEIKPPRSRSPVTERRLVRVEGKPLSETVIEERR